MSTMITAECINCGACEPECPNTAIYEGGVPWNGDGNAHPALAADVYGPSLPIMFGTAERPHATAAKRIQPLERYGIRLISMGFFLDEQSPVIWRGPLVMGIVRQFLRDVDWGPTDFLVVDLPPGTGDAQLTLVQQVPVTGGVIVTTPQDVALLDVGRTMAMFAQVSTPVLGVVENMSGYVCPQCGTWVCGASSSDQGLRRVRAGTLDDTSWLRPTAHFWTRSKQPWITLPAGDQVFATQPDA